MDCKRALAGDGRRLRRGRQAAAREGHGLGREARRPRDERRQGRRRGATTASARSSRSAARPSPSRTTRSSSPTPRSVLDAVFARRRRRGGRARGASGSSSPAKLGENIQVVGREADRGGGRRGALVLRAPAGEQGRRARAHAGRRRRSGPQPRAAPDLRAPDVRSRATRCPRSSSRPSARSSKLRRGAVEARERA